MRFRRRTPAPGEHDARALEIANRRIWKLEMTIKSLRNRVEHADRAHWLICSHAQELEDARWQRDAAKRSEYLMWVRLRNHLAQLRQIGNEVTQTIDAVDTEQEPR